jgi:hypothetical protein
MTCVPNCRSWTSLAALAGFAALAADGCAQPEASGPTSGPGFGAMSGSGGEAGVGGAGSGGKSSGGGSGGESGENAGGAAGNDTPECSTGASPMEEHCLVSDDYAVFVAPNGDDEDNGGMDTPVATFGRALTLAKRRNKIVLACTGTYDERIQITSAARIYGGFACDDGWTHAPDARSRLEPSERGYVLEIRDVPQRVVIEDVEFVAMDADEAGESSVAGFIVGFGDVLLRGVRLEAGVGVSGLNGTLEPVDFLTDEELAGNDAVGAYGGAEKRCMCVPKHPELASVGGRGGNAMPGGEAGGMGANGGKGGAIGTCDLAAQAGHAGRFAPPPPPTPSTHGTLTPSGWATFDAEDVPMVPFAPATGGGGGASTDTAGAGGGGCGGCSGAHGRGGKGGGSSLALVVIESAITLEGSDLVARDAGDGGDGSDGQLGQPGGVGGRATATACPGGTGGQGASGWGAGGGSGGMSVGLLWTGAIEPVLRDTDVATGSAGDAGTAGIPSAWSNDGLAGVSITTFRWNQAP